MYEVLTITQVNSLHGHRLTAISQCPGYSDTSEITPPVNLTAIHPQSGNCWGCTWNPGHVPAAMSQLNTQYYTHNIPGGSKSALKARPPYLPETLLYFPLTEGRKGLNLLLWAFCLSPALHLWSLLLSSTGIWGPAPNSVVLESAISWSAWTNDQHLLSCARPGLLGLCIKVAARFES